MISRYGLKEVWIPEEEDIKSKCNIFMTEEFRNDPATNKEKTAIVLI